MMAKAIKMKTAVPDCLGNFRDGLMLIVADADKGLDALPSQRRE